MAAGIIYNEDGVLIYRLWEAVPAAAEDQKIPASAMPPGAYHMCLVTRTAITGNTTVVGGIVAFVDKEQTTTAQAAAHFFLNAPNDSIPNSGSTLTLTNATAGFYRGIAPNGTTGLAQAPIVVPYGLRVSLSNKGTALTGERMEVDLVAVRVSPVLLRPVPKVA